MSLNTRGRRGRWRSRRLAPGDLGWLIALGAAVPALLIGHGLAPPRALRAAPAADTRDVRAATTLTGTAPAGTAGTLAVGTPAFGGWGEGGYPMVPGSAAGGPAANGGAAANAPAAAAAAVTDVASVNWAGYAATGAPGSFTSVSSSWAQPAVTCGAASSFSSFWVGLDGDGTPTVEQVGTEADCADGTAAYKGWYEIFPNAPVAFPDPVRPGDAMSASVKSGGNGTFILSLSDATQGWTQTTQQAEAAAQLGSAEVIAEAPSNGTVLPLANFGTVNFTGATVNQAPLGASANLSKLTTESATVTALTTPSALTGGTAFSVTADTGTSASAAPGAASAGSGPAGFGGGGGGASDGGGRRHHHHDHGL